MVKKENQRLQREADELAERERLDEIVEDASFALIEALKRVSEADDEVEVMAVKKVKVEADDEVEMVRVKKVKD